MSQTAVANPIAPAPPGVGEPVPHTPASIVVEVAADNVLAARLIHPRSEVAGALRVAVEKGADIRARRIRYQEDLDEARLDKLAWTQAVTDLLTALFDGTAVADYCNDWVGKIFPEYADLGNFVEQFYDEMEYRLAKLRSVLERVEQVGETPGIPVRSYAPTAPAPAAVHSPAPTAHAAPVVRHASPEPIGSVAPAVPAAPVAPTAPAAPRIAAVERVETAAPPAAMSHVMILGAAASDAAHSPVAALLERLGVDSHPTTDPLGVGAADAAVFIVPAQPADAMAGRVAAFQLGCAVGRLGAHRVVVLHPAGAPPCPESGVAHIPADPGGGWQLQLARHLKQAGVAVDLNKLC